MSSESEQRRPAGAGARAATGSIRRGRDALINVSENHTYRVDEPGGRATRCASTGPATAPPPDRVRAGLDRRPARGRRRRDGRRAVPATDRRAASCQVARRSWASATWSLFEWLPGDHARSRRATTCARRIHDAGRRLGAHARARPRAGAAGRLRRGSRWDYDDTLGRARPLGRLAGRPRHGRPRSASSSSRLDATMRRRLERLRRRAEPVRARPRRHPPGQPAGRRRARCG